MKLELRELTKADEQAFMEGMKEWAGEDPQWYSFVWKEGMTFRRAAGIGLAPGRVPHSMLYGFLDGRIIGRVSVRHELNDRLRKRGGHIGYAVAKRYRRRGHATEMVRQALEFCKSIGIESVMVTCADLNIPSWKIIEHFDGKLQDRVWDDDAGETIRRYWIGCLKV